MVVLMDVELSLNYLLYKGIQMSKGVSNQLFKCALCQALIITSKMAIILGKRS
jgi:hypothetical protein